MYPAGMLPVALTATAREPVLKAKGDVVVEIQVNTAIPDAVVGPTPARTSELQFGFEVTRGATPGTVTLGNV